MLRVAVRLVVDAALIATVLFASAGTLMWRRAWALLAVLMILRTVSAVAVYRVSPALLRERAKLPIHSDQPLSDRVLLMALLGTAFVGVPAIAGLDVFRWHMSPPPPLAIVGLGMVLFVLGWVIQALALRENAFAVSVVRLQHERKHTLVDSGVYRLVRHPFYVGTPLILIGMSLWLGSYAAFAVTIVPIAFLILRLKLEERFLARELPGYDEYELRVPYRLIPGIW